MSSFFEKTHLTLALITGVVVGCHGTKGIEDHVAGNWTVTPEASWFDETHCETQHHRTWLSADRKTLYQTHGEGEPDPAEVIAINADYLTIRYPNETRKDNNGDPVLWHMVFKTPDSYFWIINGRGDPNNIEQVQQAYENAHPYFRCPTT